MKKKFYFKCLVFFLLMTLASSLGYLNLFSKGVSPSNNAAVELIFNDQYSQKVLKRLKKAKKKIWLTMYVMSYSKDKSYAIENKFAKVLADQYKKGLDVKVILDASHEWSSKKRRFTSKFSKKNENVYKYLKSKGVPVRYDSTKQTMHSKSLILDNNLVIIGSTNWTYSALKRNVETSVLIHSKHQNRILSKAFLSLWKACESGQIWNP